MATESKLHIESVHLKNFLSFYEGTVKLDSGLNVIVGPNGSGKTSIFHAIKFALGSNQREHRYSRWGDFVRHGANSAEVSVFVRTDGQSRSFKRRIDRDGIPRAYLDGKRVKASELRRTVEALHFDVDNPLVFMPQERINALRELNPIEVRRLVEEGTGLYTIRDRIAEQEVKVIQNRQRVENAQSEVNVVEREIELLQHDLKRLKRKRDLLKDHHQLENELKWATLEDLFRRAEDLTGEIEGLESGLSSVLLELESLKVNINEKESVKSGIETKLQGLQTEEGRIEARIEEEERRLSKLKDDSRKTINELKHIEAELKKEKKRRNRIKQHLKRAARTKEQELEKKRDLKEKIDSIEQDLLKIENEMEVFSEWNTRRAETHGAYRAISADIQGKDVLLRSLRERLQVEEAELEGIENRWSQSWTVLENTDQKELNARKSHIEREIADLNQEHFREQSRVAQLQKEINDIQGRLKETSKRIPSEVMDLTERIKEHSLDTVLGPLLQLVRTDSQHSTALEAVLSCDIAFAFILQDHTDLPLVERLRDECDAPSPLILVKGILEEKPQLPSGRGVIGWLWDQLELDDEIAMVLHAALGYYVLVKSGKLATRIASKNNLQTVSLDGHVVESHDNRVISYPSHDSSGLISTAPLQKRLSEAQRELLVSRKQVTNLILQIESKNEEREEILTLLSQIGRWSEVWQKRSELRESIPKLEERIVSVDDKLKALQSDYGKYKRKLAKIESEQPPARSKLEDRRKATRIQLRQLQNELSSVEASLHANETDEELQRAELKRLSETLAMYNNQVSDLRQEIKDSKDESSSIIETIESLHMGLLKINDKQKTERADLERVRDEIRELSERLVELNIHIKNSQLQVRQVKRRLDIVQDERRTLENELMGLTRPVKTRNIEIVREDLARVRHLLDDYQDVTESVAQNEKRLNERLLTLQERVVELKEELDEAEITVRDIREQYHNGMNDALQDIESEVNTILSSVQFVGKVRLELAIHDGEYGVDFRTRLKGEGFEELSAGSGGERSLIAIGLILSLQRFNPAPVYALDEVDTFLDATNTEMVSQLIFDSSRRSQFILFTPAKSTHLLKHADKRIGVVSPAGTEPSVLIESPQFATQ